MHGPSSRQLVLFLAIQIAVMLVATHALAGPFDPTLRIVHDMTFSGSVWKHALLVGLPFFMVGMVGLLLYALGLGRGAARPRHRGAVITAGLLLGAGLGAFLDAIVLRQMLQWHGMVSAKIARVDVEAWRYNVFWDGVFDAFAWTVTVLGVVLVWRAARRPSVPWSARTFVGALTLGWGLLAAFEALIAHHLTAIHHVRSGEYAPTWDLGFLAIAAAIGAVGATVLHLSRADAGVAVDAPVEESAAAEPAEAPTVGVPPAQPASIPA